MNDQPKPRPYINETDESLEALYQSIIHSVIQGANSVSFWQAELTGIRHERKERKAQAEAQQQPVAEGQES